MLYKNTPAHFRQEVCGLFFVCMQNRRICGTAAKEQKTKEKASRRMQRLSEYAWAARGIKAACDAPQMRCAAACARRYVNAPSGYRFAEACRPCFFTAMMFLWADHPCGIPSGGGGVVGTAQTALCDSGVYTGAHFAALCESKVSGLSHPFSKGGLNPVLNLSLSFQKYNPPS